MIAEGIGANIKRAFLWHWHLLGLGTGAGFALLSGMPFAWVPLLAAAELAYLGFLGLQPDEFGRRKQRGAARQAGAQHQGKGLRAHAVSPPGVEWIAQYTTMGAS